MKRGTTQQEYGRGGAKRTLQTNDPETTIHKQAHAATSHPFLFLLSAPNTFHLGCATDDMNASDRNERAGKKTWRFGGPISTNC